jgi:hypothetical protein
MSSMTTLPSSSAIPTRTPDANVIVLRGNMVVATAQVPSGESTAILLPMEQALKNALTSRLVDDGAFLIEVDVPVFAYQYSPLVFEKDGTYSYTNDASLLLPEHTLTGQYRVGSWPTFGTESTPRQGFVTIVAIDDDTEVTLIASGRTHGGDIAALEGGQSQTFMLDRGDVAQVLSYAPTGPLTSGFFFPVCENDDGLGVLETNGSGSYCLLPQADLTGSRVVANKSVAVFAGHSCAYVPFARQACDHLEEQLFPVETWGSQLVVTAPRHPSGDGKAKTLIRIVADTDGTEITLIPALLPPVTLSAGAFVEIDTDEDFLVNAGTARVGVFQYMEGVEEIGGDDGDPAMGTVVRRARHVTPTFSSRPKPTHRTS